MISVPERASHHQLNSEQPSTPSRGHALPAWAPWAYPAPVLAVADARALPLVDACIDLTVTSPPYALDIGYVGGDVRAEAWPVFMADWLAETLRVTKPHGRLALNVPLDTTRGGKRPTYV